MSREPRREPGAEAETGPGERGAGSGERAAGSGEGGKTEKESSAHRPSTEPPFTLMICPVT